MFRFENKYNWNTYLECPTSRFSYSCAQSSEREHKDKIPKLEKTRDTRRIDRFPCNGWLHMILAEGSHEVSINMKHVMPHLPYVDTSLPERWKVYTKDHAKTETPGQVSSLFKQKKSSTDYLIRSGDISFERRHKVYL